MPYAPQVQSTEPSGEDYELTRDILMGIRDCWQDTQKQTNTDPVRFAKMGIVALSQWLAMVAVDVGMPEENFTAVCKAQHQQAFKNAPRFG